jgi:hypothetical protein
MLKGRENKHENAKICRGMSIAPSEFRKGDTTMMTGRSRPALQRPAPGLQRHHRPATTRRAILAKPASAITKQAAAISSAIDATPLKVSIGLSWGGHCPSTRHQCFLGPALPRIPRWGRVSRRTRPDDRKIRTNCARESKDPSYVFGNTAGVSCTHTRTGRPGARGSGT